MHFSLQVNHCFTCIKTDYRRTSIKGSHEINGQLSTCNKVFLFVISYVIFLRVFPDNGTAIHEKLKEYSGQRTVPNVYIRGKHIGGADDTIKLHEKGKLMDLIVPPPAENYTYDLIVVGGGSGGLACSKVL